MGSGETEYPMANNQYPMDSLAAGSKGYLEIGSWKLVIGSSNGAEVGG